MVYPGLPLIPGTFNNPGDAYCEIKKQSPIPNKQQMVPVVCHRSLHTMWMPLAAKLIALC